MTEFKTSLKDSILKNILQKNKVYSKNLDKYKLNEYPINRFILSDIVTKTELVDNIIIYHINVGMIKKMAIS